MDQSQQPTVATPVQAPYQAQPQQQYPPFNDHLLWSLLTTIFLAFWAGIVALVYSIGAKNAFQRGDLVTAYAKAGTARTWNIVGAVLGVIAYVLLVLGFILFAAA